MHYLFCFSKRAFKQNKQLLKIKQRRLNIKKLKKKAEIIYHLNNYKINIFTKVKINQLNKNRTKIIYLFLKSYFNTSKVRSLIYIKKKKKNIQLRFWLRFKNYFYKKLIKKLKKFPKTGMLSSQYVHVLSRKNLIYQTRSKYRSKVVTLNYFTNYIYMCTKFICIYLYNLNSFIYFFSSNSTYKNIWLDSDFCVTTSSWHTDTLNIKKKTFSSLTNRTKFYKLNNFTTENYNNNDITTLYENRRYFELFFFEEDAKKKEEMYKELLKNANFKNLNYIHTINFFIILDCINTYKKPLKNYIYIYIYFYKKLLSK